MKTSGWNAWALGAIILLAANGAVVVSLLCDAWLGSSGVFSGVLMGISAYIPVAAAFVVGYLAPRRKIILGTSMAFLGVLFSSMAVFIFQALGFKGDSVGVTGEIIFFFIGLLMLVALCWVGAAFGAMADILQHSPKADGEEFRSSGN